MHGSNNLRENALLGSNKVLINTEQHCPKNEKFPGY